MPRSQSRQDAVCLGCACLCDDITLRIENGAVVEAHSACELGRGWFSQPTVQRERACRVDGRPATLAGAVDRAAGLLAAARRPLVCGLAGVSVEAQRVAVAIADRLGGLIDGGDASAIALQTHGGLTASLGEVAQRADVIVFWRCDPATTHPRHCERYSLAPTSARLPNGRADRTVFAVGDPTTPTAAEADHRIDLPGNDYEALALLRGLQQGVAMDRDHARRATGVDLSEWAALNRACLQARFAAIFFGDALQEAGHAAVGALTDWAVDLQRSTRAVTLPLGGGRRRANAAGAENVLAWQTGYPGAVDFGRGYPTYRPGEAAAAALLERRETDALLIASAEAAGAPPGARVPGTVLLATSDAAFEEPADVAFRVAPPGFASRGSAYRSDGVALPLREPWATHALPAEEVLAAIHAKLGERAAVTSGASGP